jgi:hypothetical protein
MDMDIPGQLEGIWLDVNTDLYTYWFVAEKSSASTFPYTITKHHHHISSITYRYDHTTHRGPSKGMRWTLHILQTKIPELHTKIIASTSQPSPVMPRKGKIVHA